MRSEREQLETGIAAFEAQRGLLGDNLVDAALAPLRARLDDVKLREGFIANIPHHREIIATWEAGRQRPTTAVRSFRFAW